MKGFELQCECCSAKQGKTRWIWSIRHAPERLRTCACCGFHDPHGMSNCVEGWTVVGSEQVTKRVRAC